MKRSVANSESQEDRMTPAGTSQDASIEETARVIANWGCDTSTLGGRAILQDFIADALREVARRTREETLEEARASFISLAEQSYEIFLAAGGDEEVTPSLAQTVRGYHDAVKQIEWLKARAGAPQACGALGDCGGVAVRCELPVGHGGYHSGPPAGHSWANAPQEGDAK